MNASPAPSSESFAATLYALDRRIWVDIQAELRLALDAHRLGNLLSPTTLILHDLLDGAIKAMYLKVFRHLVETDFGLSLANEDEHFDALFKTEIAEHGAQNIARYCRDQEVFLSVQVPRSDASCSALLVRIDIPASWQRDRCQTEKLIDALGFLLEVEARGDGCRVLLKKRPDRLAMLQSPDLLQRHARLDSVGRIFDQLGYGLIHFSPVGEVIAVSPSMLAKLGLDEHEGSIRALADSIPIGFHDDITWGLALAAGNGSFENHRIRIRLPGDSPVSILFNVSGFRSPDGTIQSLWQAVSQGDGNASLAEGSILSEVRVHNITRNYVPQLVEQKARDAVRLGKNALTNEDRMVAVLFCDIVGFTSYVESNADNESIIDTLNSILRRISGSVKSNHGAIDKFMGDCIMALFDDPADAVLAAANMQNHSDDINRLRSRAGQQMLQLRIGIHWGEVVIGNVGTAERLDWTAIGDVVNTASRIEKGCQPGSILISDAMRQVIEASRPGQFQFGPVFGLQVKGKRDELQVCHVTVAGK